MPTTLFEAVSFTDAAEVFKTIGQTRKKECTYTEFVDIRERVLTNKTEIIQVFQKLTIKDIGKYIYSRPGSKKAELVEDLWEAAIGSFDIKEGALFYQVSPGINDHEQRIIDKIRAADREDFNKWQAKRAKEYAELEKALTNPETLEEYRTFIRKKGEKSLSQEQRIKYDELVTGRIQESKQSDEYRKSQLTAVAVGETDMIIIPTVHTKKQIPLWVVRLSERVPKHIYDQLNERAKSMGGYYSSYRGHGAIPGFTFTQQEAAELFIQIKDGDVNAAEIREALNLKKIQLRAQNVQEKASTIEQAATEELQKDRRVNTARRARIATSAEQRAIADIEFAKTMFEIGERMQRGTILYLGKLSTIVQLEELYSLLSACKWNYIHDKQLNADRFEYSAEVAEYAKFPYPILYKHDHLRELLVKLCLDRGKVLAANRMMKRLNAEKGEFLTIQQDRALEDYERLFCRTSPHLQFWESTRWRDQYVRYNRIKRLGFTTIYEIRTALRELIEIDKTIIISEDLARLQQIRELERKFVNAQIPGFFPTPLDLGATVVEKAQIEAGHTILEPEAGLGHLAQAILEAHPEADITCIELCPSLAEALNLKGFNTVCADFLKIKEGLYDRIIMNPPFENLQDIDHVYHAWTLLKPGGRLVSIMANNKAGERQKVRDFVQFVDQYGSMEKNEDGAFMSAFRPTGANTITVVLDKPE